MKPQVKALHRRMVKSMTTECVVHRQDGFTMDPNNYAEIPKYVEVYAGRCLLRPTNRAGEDGEAAKYHFVLTDYVVSVPAGVECLPKDRVTITGGLNPGVAGTELWVDFVKVDDWRLWTELTCQVSTRK